MECVNNRYRWNDSCPAVYGHTSISFLKRCPGFRDAKNGDLSAAFAIVSSCVKTKLINEIKDKYPNSVLLPIITKNRLPEALAMIIGLKVQLKISLNEALERKSLNAMERLLHTPDFTGKIESGKAYIIVDDIVTQGGTVSALRKYIVSQGGIVLAIVALAYAVNSRKLSPSKQNISALMLKFNSTHLMDVLQKYNIAKNYYELTNSQVKYLLKFKELNNISDKLNHAYNSLKRKGYNVFTY